MKTYNTDDPKDVATLKAQAASSFELYPRRWRSYGYGTDKTYKAFGVIPVDASPDVVLPTNEWKEAIARAHEKQNMPMYHQYNSWAPEGFVYNQDGLGYCWTWGGTAAVMDCRALEKKKTTLLAPVSMGYLVGWQNRGNYLGSFIKGAKNDGICPAVNGNVNSHQNSSSYWSQHDADRDKYRLATVWDCDRSQMWRHCVSILCYGVPIYVAYNWWGHALELVGVRWDERQPSNVRAILRNSHRESDLIELTGSRAQPSEAYGFCSTVETGV
jgi:hypothetical protein